MVPPEPVLTLLKVEPPFVEICHWKGVAPLVPVDVTLKTTLWLGGMQMVFDCGCAVMTGPLTVSGAVWLTEQTPSVMVRLIVPLVVPAV